jgi:hypothetical protein
MKYILPIIAICFSTIGAIAQNDALAIENLVPHIRFEEPLHDFGDVVQGETVSYVFTFENIGNETLVISNVLTTCGCTATEWPRIPIAPGKSGQITARFNTVGKIGKQDKILTILSNAENPQEKISLKSNILPRPYQK